MTHLQREPGALGRTLCGLAGGAGNLTVDEVIANPAAAAGLHLHAKCVSRFHAIRA